MHASTQQEFAHSLIASAYSLFAQVFVKLDANAMTHGLGTELNTIIRGENINTST